MRATSALGVMPCSTSVTRMALKVTDCCGVGARPVSFRKAMSPRLKWPSISEGRARPRTVILSGVLWPSSVCRVFLILLIAGLKVERDKRDKKEGAMNLSPRQDAPISDCHSLPLAKANAGPGRLLERSPAH